MTAPTPSHAEQRELAQVIEARLKEMYVLGEVALGPTLGEGGPLVRDVSWVTAGAALRHLASRSGHGEDE